MKRRLISLAMVFVLTLALGTVALATQNHPALTPGTGTATIYITAGEDELYSGTITGLTLEAGLHNLNMSDEWAPARDWVDQSVYHDALTSFDGYASEGGDFDDLPDSSYTYQGVVYTEYNTTPVTNHEGYFLLKTVPNVYNELEQTYGTQYHYLYIGKDWTYSDNQTGINYGYMCCYVLNGQSITMTYEVQTAAWDTFTPIT